MHFVAAALPKVPICVLKLGDRTSLTNISSAPLARHRRACHVRAAAPPEGRGGASEPGRFIFSPLTLGLKRATLSQKKGQDGAGGLGFRDGGAPKSLYMRVPREGSTGDTS